MEELRHTRFLIRAFGGVSDNEWSRVKKRICELCKKDNVGDGDDDDEVDAAVADITQEEFMLMGSRLRWWEQLRAAARIWRSTDGGRRTKEEVEEGEDDTDARVMGMGLWGRVTGRELDPDAPYAVRMKHARLCQRLDRRPFFTYWVCAVQILSLLLVLVANGATDRTPSSFLSGFAPFGVGSLAHRAGLVLTEFLTLEQVDVLEPSNFWLGPDAAALIRAGAGFAPCMRPRSAAAETARAALRASERQSGCCVRNDGSGCAQTDRSSCSSTLSEFHSGTVCGLDPAYCRQPASVAPHAWGEDITRWPVCRVAAGSGNRTRSVHGVPAHMNCDVIARQVYFNYE